MFKKLVILSVLSVLSMNLSAAILNQAQIEEFQMAMEQLPATARPYRKAFFQLNIDILGNECPETFAELKQAAIASAKKHIPNDSEAAHYAACWLTPRVISYYPSFIPEGYAMAKEHGLKAVMCRYVMYRQKEVGITDAAAYEVLINALKSNEINASDYSKILPYVVKVSADIDNQTVKKDLQRINSLVTTRMTSNEEQWKPVVIIIRTILDSYK